MTNPIRSNEEILIEANDILKKRLEEAVDIVKLANMSIQGIPPQKSITYMLLRECGVRARSYLEKYK